jgi:hypothetical protein
MYVQNNEAMKSSCEMRLLTLLTKESVGTSECVAYGLQNLIC